MQQKIYRLFLDKSVLGTAEKKELKHYCEEMKELAEKSGAKCALLKVLFQGIFMVEAEKIVKSLRKQLPGIEVVGV